MVSDSMQCWARSAQSRTWTGAHHSSVKSQRRNSSDPALLMDAMRRAIGIGVRVHVNF